MWRVEFDRCAEDCDDTLLILITKALVIRETLDTIRD
jgi:hypothetical protein